MLYIGIGALWLSMSEFGRLSASEKYVLTDNFLGFEDKGSFAGVSAIERATVRLLKCSTGEVPYWWLWMVPPFVIYLLLDMPGIL
jgi:hypothetical protein